MFLALMWISSLAWATEPFEPSNTPPTPGGLPAPTFSQIVGSPPILLEGLVAEAGTDEWFSMYSDCCLPLSTALRAFGPGLEITLFDNNGVALRPSNSDVTRIRQGNWRGFTLDDAGGYYTVRIRNAGSADVPYTLGIQAEVYGP